MIYYLLINSLCIIGFHVATEEGMVLHFVERWLADKPEWMQKPIYSCPYCMASVHSLYIFPLSGLSIYYLPIYILALCGLNVITHNVARILREFNN